LPPSERDRIGAVLERRLSLRPTSEQLLERNILHSTGSQQLESERRQQIRLLARKLSYRPTVEELRDRQIIKFSDYVEVTRTEDYDRVTDKPWTCLSEVDKEKIRKELNAFKSKEMPVHKNSRKYTRYHKS
uniref:Phosphatase and actin regulator n=1 Tax=Macrostomum lignano TaxID=282301 RepID=A0A1I8GJD5_9PLAT